MSEEQNCQVPGERPAVSFEQALQRLETIVAKLEAGELTLDESLALFEEGVQLSRVCNARLAEAELKMERLIERADGSLTTEALLPGERKQS